MRTVTDILDEYHVQWQDSAHHHVRDGWVGVDCPICSPSSGKYRLGFSLTSGAASCWMCGPLRPAEMLAKLCRISLRQAIGIYRDLTLTGSAKKTEPAVLRELKRPSNVNDLHPVHKEYLNSRGFRWQDIVYMWDVQGITIDATYGWRIYIPIYDRFGREVSWTTRSTNPTHPRRYMAAPEDWEAYPSKRLLYGEHLVHTPAVVVVEGATDVWAIGPGAVGTLGIAVTDFQLQLIAQYPSRTIVFDKAKSAQRRADHLCQRLSDLPGHTQRVRLVSGDDPATCDPAEIAELRQHIGLV